MQPMQIDVRRHVARVALILTGGVFASRLWFIAFRALDIDEFEHAHATWCVSRGQMPYVDFFEHHTPWLYLAFAPLFRLFATDTSASAAVSLFFVLRLAMLAVTIACVVCVYVLGREWRDRFTGILAAFLIATASQFQDSMMEFRPDVPALLGFLLSLLALIRAWRAGRNSEAAALLTLGGLAFGASVLFTQKILFAGPGLAFALLAYVAGVGRAPGGWIARAGHVACFTLAAAVPAAGTMWWFFSHGALGAFIHYNVVFNVDQNAQRFSPLPRLFSHLIHSPALLVLGFGGFAAAIREGRSGVAGSRLVLLSTAASLFAGVFAFGRVYDQYLVDYFPHLAVFGASWAQSILSRVSPAAPRPSWLTAGLVLTPAACLVALLFGVEAPTSGTGVAMLAGFTLAALLAAAALDAWWRDRAPAAAGLALTALVAMHYANLARVHEPIAPQVIEIAYVTEHTRPTDIVLSVTSGPGVFRPHAWFYFFLSGPFVTASDLAGVADDLESGRLRPQIVVLSEYEEKLPRRVWQYVRRHYRHVDGNLWERRAG